MLFEEDNLKCYTEKYSRNRKYYLHQYVANVEGIDVSLYAISKVEGNEEIKEAVKTIISRLSIDENVGFYLDKYLSYSGLDGIALKSYKLVNRIRFGGTARDTDKICLNGNVMLYNSKISSWDSMKISDKNTVYGTIKNMKIGYYVSSGELIIYIYNSKVIDGEDYFSGSPQVVFFSDYQKSNMTPEELVKLFADNLVQY